MKVIGGDQVIGKAPQGAVQEYFVSMSSLRCKLLGFPREAGSTADRECDRTGYLSTGPTSGYMIRCTSRVGLVPHRSVEERNGGGSWWQLSVGGCLIEVPGQVGGIAKNQSHRCCDPRSVVGCSEVGGQTLTQASATAPAITRRAGARSGGSPIRWRSGRWWGCHRGCRTDRYLQVERAVSPRRSAAQPTGERQH